MESGARPALEPCIVINYNRAIRPSPESGKSMKKRNRFLILASLLFAHTVALHAAENCDSLVASAQEAANRADLVIEADITLFFHEANPPRATAIVVEKTRTLFALEPAKLHATLNLSIDSCFPGRDKTFSLASEERMKGKKMRFYLTKLSNADAYRVFFMQRFEEAPPAFTKPRENVVAKVHEQTSGNPLPDGWNRAHSTDGKFSIDMPGTFQDVTRDGPGQPGFMLRGTDKNGSIFIAVFQRSGPGAGLAGPIDQAYQDQNATTFTFKGATALTTKSTVAGPQGKMISHGLWFRIPGGTYMLGIASPEGHEVSPAVRERFYNSLRFE